VQFVVVQRLLGLRRDARTVVGQAERVFQDQVGDPVGIHQGEAGRGHAAGRVAEHGDVPDAEVVEQGRGIRCE
jgi:hypothetical protein